MNVKIIRTISFLFFLCISMCAEGKTSTQYTNPKLGKITTEKKIDKKIIILMVLGLSIPLTAGYYIIKKK